MQMELQASEEKAKVWKHFSNHIKMTPRGSECEEEKTINKNTIFLLGEGCGDEGSPKYPQMPEWNLWPWDLERKGEDSTRKQSKN